MLLTHLESGDRFRAFSPGESILFICTGESNMSPKSANGVELPHSVHAPVPHATVVGKAAGDREIRVSVILNRKTKLDIATLKGRQLSREEYAASYGASQKDFDAVRAFAQANGLKVDAEKSSLLRRRVELRGPISAFNRAFGVELNDYEPSGTRQKGTRFHAIVGSVTVPEELVGSIEAVLGLDNRPIATPKFRRRKSPAAANPDAGTFTPPQVAQVYNFPSAPSGTFAGAGQTIGIIELGGGYNPADLTNYFSQTIGIRPPSVTDVTLDGGSNDPTKPNSADAEVLLDIEVAGSVAPGASIVVYFTTNTDQGFQDAISMAIHDTTNNPSVISISWGGPESSWSQTAITSMDSTCQSATALGITITVASGDNGSTDGGTGNNVDFPASSPNVLGCGGTALTASSGVRQSEVVWNDQASGGGASGGGVSAVFPMPSWQANAGVPVLTDAKHKHNKSADNTGGRGVPDVAGDASPETGYQIRVDGEQQVVGGTSAVAPLWAGLIAALNQRLGKKLGFLNPRLYALGKTPFFDITSGNNGAFSAGPGWDPCTGLGSPNGMALLSALMGGGAAMSQVTPIRPGVLEAAPIRSEHRTEGFLRGVAACVDMLSEMDIDESALVHAHDKEPHRVQRNRVLDVLEAILKRNESAELAGFTAALTEVCASADEQGDYFRLLRGYLRDRGITKKRWKP
jgi:kumamolisin